MGKGLKGVGKQLKRVEEQRLNNWEEEEEESSWQRLKSFRIENTQSLFLLEHEQTHFHQADNVCIKKSLEDEIVQGLLNNLELWGDNSLLFNTHVISA